MYRSTYSLPLKKFISWHNPFTRRLLYSNITGAEQAEDCNQRRHSTQPARDCRHRRPLAHQTRAPHWGESPSERCHCQPGPHRENHSMSNCIVNLILVKPELHIFVIRIIEQRLINMAVSASVVDRHRFLCRSWSEFSYWCQSRSGSGSALKRCRSKILHADPTSSFTHVKNKEKTYFNPQQFQIYNVFTFSWVAKRSWF